MPQENQYSWDIFIPLFPEYEIKDGSAVAEGLTVNEMKAVILWIKGIGEKRASDNAAALSRASENKGKARRENHES